MRSSMRFFGITLFLLMACQALMAKENQPIENTISLGNYYLCNKKKLSNLRIHYYTLGHPSFNNKGQITNAVLLFHSTLGSAREWVQRRDFFSLYGNGKPLDIRHYYIIIPDLLGAGKSSKPSDGLFNQFPQYGYHDQIHITHAVLQKINVVHENIVMGISMGGMLTWLWGEEYPHDADKLVAIASTPSSIVGRNLLWRNLISQTIRDCLNSETHVTIQISTLWARVAAILITIMTADPVRLAQQMPTRIATLNVENDTTVNTLAKKSPVDFLYILQSSYDYHPELASKKIKALFLAINFKDDLLNPLQLLNLPQLPNLKHIIISDPNLLYGHLTIDHPESWTKNLAQFLKT